MFITLSILAGTSLLVILLRHFFFIVQVQGLSMLPMFRNGDLLIALRHFPLKWLRRGQVLVWRPIPERSNASNFTGLSTSITYIKRIAGLPGERVILRNRIWGLQNDEFNSKIPENQTFVDVPLSHLFVEGDSVGYDSHRFGPIPNDWVIGLALFRIRMNKIE